MPKSLPDDVRFKSQGVTDGDEGKEPVGIISEKPLLSLLSLPVRLAVHLKLFVKAEEGIVGTAHAEQDAVVLVLLRSHSLESDGRPAGAHFEVHAGRTQGTGRQTQDVVIGCGERGCAWCAYCPPCTDVSMTV